MINEHMIELYRSQLALANREIGGLPQYEII